MLTKIKLHTLTNKAHGNQLPVPAMRGVVN